MRPRFTLALVYLFGFFFAFSLILALPALIDAIPPGDSAELTPEELQLASDVARSAVAGRLHFAFALAVASTGAGMYWGALPGMREGRGSV